MLQSLQIGGLVDTHCPELDECMLDKSSGSFTKVKVLIQYEVVHHPWLILFSEVNMKLHQPLVKQKCEETFIVGNDAVIGVKQNGVTPVEAC